MNKVNPCKAADTVVSLPGRAAPPKPARKPMPCKTGGALEDWGRRVRRLPEIRRDLVERVRAEIAAGTYETPERIDAAIDALLAEMLDHEG